MTTSNEQVRDSARRPAVFIYRGRLYLMIAWLAITAFFGLLSFTVLGGKRHSVSINDVIIAGSFLIIFVAGVVALRGKSDIVVDGHGISRRLLGWTWQRIQWNDIAVIRIVPLFNPALQRVVRVISIHPATLSRFALLLSRPMVFMDVAINMGELIEMMNTYIAQYEISVETVCDGKKTPVTHL